MVPTLVENFKYFYVLVFKFNNFKKTLVCLVFCCSTASYNVTCDCSIRISYVTVVLEYISSQPSGARLARPISSEVIFFTDR